MHQEIRFATFNVCNLALPGMAFYDNLAPYTASEYESRITWMAQQLDRLDADVIGFQEIFSQAALKDVLAKTQKYQQAHHIGFDPDPQIARLTPSVALVSRLPLAGAALSYGEFPRNLAITLPDVIEPLKRFARPVLHVPVLAPNGLVIQVFVVHLKSKRPDYRNAEQEDDPYQQGMAALRSLLRRGAEALGLRYLLTDLTQNQRQPLVVMGDFNDVIGAVTTQLVMGSGRRDMHGADNHLFESYRLQPQCNLSRDVGYTHMHDGTYDTVDHILLSGEFNPASGVAIGEVAEVMYLNDHVTFKTPHASDHGLVMARIALYDRPNGAAIAP